MSYYPKVCDRHGKDVRECCPSNDSRELTEARAEIARLISERDQAVAHRVTANEEIKRLHVVIKGKGFSVEDSVALVALRDEVARLTAELTAARAVPADVEAAMHHYGEVNSSPCWTAKAHSDAEDDLRAAIAQAIATAAAPPPTVGGLLAAGEERESRAWSEKGKAPPGSCPFCASRISMVQRDGYFIARCSHRGCGAVGPRMRSVSRAADLFCQPPRREAQGMSCGPIVASPPRPRCSCTHEAGDSRCDVHPTCSECGATTPKPAYGCSACRGPLPKGG